MLLMGFGMWAALLVVCRHFCICLTKIWKRSSMCALEQWWALCSESVVVLESWWSDKIPHVSTCNMKNVKTAHFSLIVYVHSLQSMAVWRGPDSNQWFYYEYKDAESIQDCSRITQEIVYTGYSFHSWRDQRYSICKFFSLALLNVGTDGYMILRQQFSTLESISAVSIFLYRSFTQELRGRYKIKLLQFGSVLNREWSWASGNLIISVESISYKSQDYIYLQELCRA